MSKRKSVNGTGNSLVNVNPSLADRLGSEYPGIDRMRDFLVELGEPIKIEISPRITTRQLGNAYYRENKIRLYRHKYSELSLSSWVFLHETAHIIAYKDHHATGHGELFAQTFETLIDLWEIFKTEVKADEIKKTV